MRVKARKSFERKIARIERKCDENDRLNECYKVEIGTARRKMIDQSEIGKWTR